MALYDYDLGGNEKQREASEAIADIPSNRSLVVEQLTADEPAKPEAVYGLDTIEAVFKHFLPNVDIEFETEEGQPVKENLKFASVGDFGIKNMTEQSRFMRSLSQKQAAYETIIKQLRTNKVLQRVLQDPEQKAAFLSALTRLRDEIVAAETN